MIVFTWSWRIFFFFLHFCIYGFSNCFDILNFLFSNIIPRGVSTCKILSFMDWCFKKYKAQKIGEFCFKAFLADFFLIRPSKLLPLILPFYPGTLKMFLLSAQKNSQVWISCPQLVSRPSKLDVFLWKIYCRVSLKIILRQK